MLLFCSTFFFCSWALPVVSGGLRVGDLTESYKEMVAGKTLQELKQETEAFAKTEVRRFLALKKTLDGSVIPIGSNLLTELANSKQRGGDGADENSAGEGIVPKMLAGLIRERGAHAVVWHPTQKRYQFASDFHASAAIELLRSRSPWARLRRFFSTLTLQESPHSLSQNSRGFRTCRIHNRILVPGISASKSASGFGLQPLGSSSASAFSRS